MFEKMLLLIGISVAVVGFYMLNKAFIEHGRVFDLDMLMNVFLWFNLIFLMILCAIAENQREELGIIVQDQAKELRIMREETQLLRQINEEHLEEIKLLREEFGSKRRKK